MTSQIRPYSPPRAFIGEIIQPAADASQDPAYREIVATDAHLRKVINTLLKERSGQPLTEKEKSLINLHIAAKQWQLNNTNKER